MEKWKDIPGYENHYQISSLGRVRSLKRKGKREEKILNQALSKGVKRKEGYLSVVLSKNSIQKTHFVHRLVANNFTEKPEGILQINHKDGNKLNNNCENLEWVTGQENILHATRSGLRYSKLKRRQVTAIKKEYLKGEKSQYELARKYKINQSVVSRIINNKAWSK